MRDLAFILFFVVVAVFAIRRPFIAVSLWVWSGLFVPVYWLYGFAEAIRYNAVFGALTLIAYFFLSNKPKISFNGVFFLVALLFIQICISSLFSLSIPQVTAKSFENFFKIFVLFISLCLIVRKENHFNTLIWAVVLSIGFYSTVEGLKFLSTAGGHAVKGPQGHIISDNNIFAVAVLTSIPLQVYLLRRTSEKWLRWALIGSILMCVAAVIGTSSRGGFVGLLVVGGYFYLKMNKKLVVSLVMIAVVSFGISFVPDHWVERMQTIKTAEQESSFMTRVNAWKINTLMAMERPLIGGGFNATAHGHIWRTLALDIDKLDFGLSSDPGDKGWAAHSKYFQVLGDHGFLGLFIYLMIFVVAFSNLSSVERFYSKGDWQSELARMLKVSLAAYCVSGAAVSVAYLDLLYVLLAMTVCLKLVTKDEKQKQRVKRMDALAVSY